MEGEREILKKTRIEAGDSPLFCEDRIGDFELRKADGGADVGHPVIVADRIMPIAFIRGNSLSF